MKRRPTGNVLEQYRAEISRCVKCGSCRAVCPSFLAEQKESHSARGLMALIQAFLDGRISASGIFKDRLATCTTCFACEEACASGVRVTEIIQAAKELVEEKSGAGMVHAVIAGVVKRPALFRAGAWFATRALHYSGGEGKSSKGKERRAKKTGGSKEKRKGTVAIFPGCAIEYFQPDVGRATTAVLNRLGYEVIVPEGLKCCGRPLLSLGDRKAAEELAAHNIGLLTGLGADVVVTACASCGLTFKKEYPKLLRPGTKLPAVQDIHEFLADKLGDIRMGPVKKSITIHDPCHLGRGQGLSETVRELLRAIPGLTLVEMENPDRCCGFGGVMRVTHRRHSDLIAEEKAKSIIATGASTVATGCPGCRMQISHALQCADSSVETLHPVQLLAESLECEID